MSEINNEQNIRLSVMQKDIEYIKEALDKQNAIHLKDIESNKALLENHCQRIRLTEQKLTGIEPIKKLYDKMALASFGIMVVLGMAVIGLAYTITEKFKH